MNNYLYLGTLAILISACKSGGENLVHKSSDKTDFISCIKPFKDLEIAPDVFEIESTIQNSIPLKNGGRIEFPANAFVDQDGKPVQGKVQIEWQEYHSLSDIILSGIPMKYDSAGVQNDFVSGGMFTLKAKQNNEELELAPNKKAKVDLVSLQDTPCFNFYKLDEKTGDWAYKTTKEGSPNPGFKEQVKPGEPKEEKFQLIDAQLNTSRFPELKDKNIVAWKTKDKIDKTDFNAHSAQLMAGKNPNEYLLEVNANKKIKVYTVQPYTLEEAKKNSRKVEKTLEKDFTEELAFQNDLMTGKIIRSIEVESLGTHNWDAILHLENHTDVFVDLAFPKNIKKQSVNLYLVCPEMNVVIKVDTEGQKSGIKFDPNKSFCLIGILTDNSIVTLKKDALSSLKKSRTGDIVKLNFDKTGKQIKRGQDLSDYIGEQI